MFENSKGLTTVMGTNGTLIDDAVANRLAESGIQGVGVSLDSAAPAYHDRFRVVDGAWDKAVAGIAALKRRRCAQSTYGNNYVWCPRNWLEFGGIPPEFPPDRNA